jgi:hypothetical protein
VSGRVIHVEIIAETLDQLNLLKAINYFFHLKASNE